jgi:hypothetical protein
MGVARRFLRHTCSAAAQRNIHAGLDLYNLSLVIYGVAIDPAA